MGPPARPPKRPHRRVRPILEHRTRKPVGVTAAGQRPVKAARVDHPARAARAAADVRAIDPRTGKKFRKPAVWTYEPQLVQRLCDRVGCPHCITCGCPLAMLYGEPARFSCVRCIGAGKGIAPGDIADVPLRTGEQF